MPVLKVGAWSDDPMNQYRLSVQVFALMLFPFDFLAQDEWASYEATHIGAVYEANGQADVADAIKNALVGPKFYTAMVRVLAKEPMQERVKQAELSGTKAGDILRLVLQLDDQYGGGSLNTAVQLLPDVYRHRVTPWGEPVIASHGSLKAAWLGSGVIATLGRPTTASAR